MLHLQKVREKLISISLYVYNTVKKKSRSSMEVRIPAKDNSPVTSLVHRNAMLKHPWDQSDYPHLPAGWAAFLVRFLISHHTIESLHKAEYTICMITNYVLKNVNRHPIGADWDFTAGTF